MLAAPSKQHRPSRTVATHHGTGGTHMRMRENLKYLYLYVEMSFKETGRR